MWKNIVTIHSVLKKRTIMQNYQPAQYKKNKIDKDHFGKKKKKIHNKRKKTMQKNIVVIHNVLKKKTTELNFLPVQY